MSKYGISVIEILKRTVIVEAGDIDEAIRRVEDEVEQGKLALTDRDYNDREIVPSKYWKGGKVPDDEDVSLYWNIQADDQREKGCQMGVKPGLRKGRENDESQSA